MDKQVTPAHYQAIEFETRFIALSDGRVTGHAGRITRPAVPRLWPFTRLPRLGDPSEPSLAPQTVEPLAPGSPSRASTKNRAATPATPIRGSISSQPNILTSRRTRPRVSPTTVRDTQIGRAHV